MQFLMLMIPAVYQPGSKVAPDFVPDPEKMAAMGRFNEEMGKALKILYATQASVRPPTFVFFVNEPELVHFAYRRFLENQLREAFSFEGTPIRLRFRGREGRPDGREDE